jgi:MoaA/NifB/PqqE/SkfB family radical SAM enzyme
MGVDKLKISLDSIDENVYEKTRGQKKGYHKAIEALFICKEAECRQWFKLSCHIKPAGRMPLKN